MGWNKTLIRALEKADGGMSEVKSQSEMHSSSLLSQSKTLPQNTKSWRIWLNEEYLLTFLKCNEFDSNTVEEKKSKQKHEKFYGVTFSGETEVAGKTKGVWTLLLFFVFGDRVSVSHILGWLWTHSVLKDDLEFWFSDLYLLGAGTMCRWNSGLSTCLGKHATNWATIPALLFLNINFM